MDLEYLGISRAKAKALCDWVKEKVLYELENDCEYDEGENISGLDKDLFSNRLEERLRSSFDLERRFMRQDYWEERKKSKTLSECIQELIEQIDIVLTETRGSISNNDEKEYADEGYRDIKILMRRMLKETEAFERTCLSRILKVLHDVHVKFEAACIGRDAKFSFAYVIDEVRKALGEEFK